MPIALRDTVAGCVLDQPGALPLGSPAAVLVPILDGDEPEVVFTRRSDSLRHHRGEISFPGGRPHPDDADLRATALRETHEELGLPAEAIDVAGCLEPVQARVSGFTIVPFVGLLSERPEFVPSPDEIAEVIEIPLRDLLAIEEEREWEFEGGSYQTYAYVQDGHTVWGATARILKELLDGLRRGGWR